MKFFIISALICSVLVLVQCASQHNPYGPVYDGLDSILDEAEKQTQLFANDLTHRLNETLTSIKEKVDQWKNNNAFTKQLESFQAEGNKCIKEHEMTAQFMRNLVSTYDSCSQEVKQLVHDKLTAMNEVLSVIKNAPGYFKDLPEECLPKENGNLAVGSLCVVTRLAEIQEAISEANIFVENFINHGVEEVEAFAAEKCKGIKNLDQEFEELFNKIQTCIQNNKQ